MEPNTLQDAILYFGNPNNCRDYLIAHRWPDGVICPRCGSKKVLFQAKYNRWQCGVKHDRRQFTSKTGTIFEDSPLSLDKWLLAMWQVVNCKNGVSSYEIHRAIGVTQKTAWFMDHRIRVALGMATNEKLSGTVEADETFVGGKARNMHKSKLARLKAEGRTLTAGGKGKAIVMGLLERHGKARVKVTPHARAYQIRTNLIENVEKGSKVYSDALLSYRNIHVDGFEHEFVDHTEEYVKGLVHTNGMENFWSLFKRALKGTYVSVEPFHLQAYADEQAFRFNNRKLTDGERFSMAVSGIVGKRLTFDELTGKVEDRSSEPLPF